MKGKEPDLILYLLTGFGVLILFQYHRTLDIAKTVMKERSYVYSKTDQIIHLSKDGKLEKVICVLTDLDSVFLLQQEASTMTCNLQFLTILFNFIN